MRTPSPQRLMPQSQIQVQSQYVSLKTFASKSFAQNLLALKPLAIAMSLWHRLVHARLVLRAGRNPKRLKHLKHPKPRTVVLGPDPVQLLQAQGSALRETTLLLEDLHLVGSRAGQGRKAELEPSTRLAGGSQAPLKGPRFSGDPPLGLGEMTLREQH